LIIGHTTKIIAVTADLPRYLKYIDIDGDINGYLRKPYAVWELQYLMLKHFDKGKRKEL
jgi:hypothetical protein